MKFKFKRNKKTGEVLINLGKVSNKDELRYYIYSNIINHHAKNLTIALDTNRRTNTLKLDEIEALLESYEISHKVYKIESAANGILGFNIRSSRKKNRLSDRMYILDVDIDDFSREFFDSVLASFDIATGINRGVEFEKICQDIRDEELEDVLFKTEYFEHSIYDSSIATMMRTYVDVSQYSK